MLPSISKITPNDNRNKHIKNINQTNQHLPHKYKCKFDSKKTRIKTGITVSVGVNIKIQKNIVCTKKIIFGILQHVVANMVNM